MITNPSTAVVVVNYGSHRLLQSNLAAVAAERPDLLVVVVDNFSSAAERQAVEALCTEHDWVLVPSPDNVGYGQGNNLGVAEAAARGATRFLLLNPDARIGGDGLAALEAAVTADPLILVAPVIETTDGRVWFDGSDLYLADGHMRATRKRLPGTAEQVEPWLTGACLMISKELWDRVGGFDPSYFLYWEDVDLSWRCVRAGGRLEVLRSARAVHDEGATQSARGGERARSNTYYYFNIRNRLLFAGKHLDRISRRRWLRRSLGEAYGILVRGGRRQLITSTGPWRAALRGTVDGLRAMRTARTGKDRADSAAGPLRVLQSFPAPRPTTNPYIVMLAECLDAHPDVELRTFTWRRALTERFDVFHAHWPEILVSGQSPAKALVRQAMYALFLIKLRLQGTAIVRTLHNLELPSGISRREIALLRLTERHTSLFIRLNEITDVDRPHATIVHGHYRDWFARYPREPQQPGRFAYFGLIRTYKAVDTLLRAFTGIPADRNDVSLVVGGKPSSQELRDELESLAAPDPRVSLKLEFLPDETLVAVASAAELIVLPYREMHNSGGVLAALSLDRPVLSPDNEVNRRLGAEVGERWVHRFEPPLTADILLDVLCQVRREREQAPSETPDLSKRDWSGTAEQHVAAYRRAVALRRTPAPR
jgi:GT2 family glycosyltransferase